jgi:hypothetical protein
MQTCCIFKLTITPALRVHMNRWKLLCPKFHWSTHCKTSARVSVRRSTGNGKAHEDTPTQIVFEPGTKNTTVGAKHFGTYIVRVGIVTIALK